MLVVFRLVRGGIGCLGFVLRAEEALRAGDTVRYFGLMEEARLVEGERPQVSVVGGLVFFGYYFVGLFVPGYFCVEDFFLCCLGGVFL